MGIWKLKRMEGGEEEYTDIFFEREFYDVVNFELRYLKRWVWAIFCKF